MLTETTITLYNKYKVSTGDKYKKTIIKKDNRVTGATWQGQKIATVSNTEIGKGMLNMADSINIRIPLNNNFEEGKSYIDPKAWVKLPEVDRDNYFTLQIGDKVVKGECSYEFIDATTPITKLDVFDNVVTIMSCKVNNYGSRTMQHYAIGGK